MLATHFLIFLKPLKFYFSHWPQCIFNVRICWYCRICQNRLMFLQGGGVSHIGLAKLVNYIQILDQDCIEFILIRLYSIFPFWLKFNCSDLSLKANFLIEIPCRNIGNIYLTRNTDLVLQHWCLWESLTCTVQPRGRTRTGMWQMFTFARDRVREYYTR